MPLIWNDEIYRWIGDEEPYDESEYFVVRKLYVELKSTTNASRTLSEITKIFKKYGPLEKVELRHSHRHDYAHITFCNDKDACLAMFVEKSDQSEIVSSISPASTWKQPSAMEQLTNDATVDSDKASLLMLNDDCLLKIFEYCDLHTKGTLWRVCRRMQNLLEDFRSKVNAYEIEFVGGAPKTRLKRVREDLQFIGQHIKKLRLADDQYAESMVNLDRYLQQCSKYVGSSLKELELHQLPPDISALRDSMIQPLLSEIESLSVYYFFGHFFVNPINIQLPKLKELKLDGREDCCTTDIHLLRHTFPYLERAIIRPWVGNKYEIQTFLKNNRHLKYLEINTGFQNELVNHIYISTN